MVEMRSVYRLLVGKLEGKTQLWRPRRKGIKRIFKK
jgi:hypothetical protein